jgi:hypothetical protein
MVDTSLILEQIKRYGYAPAYNWEFRIGLPPIILNDPSFKRNIDDDTASASARLILSCEQVDIPGKLIATTEHRIHQLRTKMPYNAIMEDINVTYRCSDDMFERKFFEGWTNLIQNPVSRNYNYHNEYTSTAEIYQYSHYGTSRGSDEKQVVYGIRLYECYPLGFVQLSGDQSAENQYHRQNVIFTYKYWEPIDIRDNLAENANASSSLLIDPINIFKNIFSI